MTEYKVLAITATKNRHHSLERSVRFFLDQTYPNSFQLIYNNSCVTQRLNNNIPSNVILVNNCISYKTKKPYETLGAIYNDAITHIPDDIDIITFWDDDDIFLPNHIEEGVKGLIKGGKTSYKPKKSYYRSSKGISFAENNLEPSVFTKVDHIKKYGFSDVTGEQHLNWYIPLINSNDIFIDPEGISTLCYNWGDNFFAWKTSGDMYNPENFRNYEKYSEDIGDQIITPLSKKEVEGYYKQILK